MLEVSPAHLARMDTQNESPSGSRRRRPFLDRLLLVSLLLPAGVFAQEPENPPTALTADSFSTSGGPSVPAQVGKAILDEVKRYASDTGALVIAPLHWDEQDRTRAAGAFVIIGGAFAADHSIDLAAQRNRSDFTDSVSRATSDFGARYSFYIAGALLAGGLISGNHDIRDTGREALEASLIAGLFTSVVFKPTFGRWRPNESDGAMRFESFSGHRSFPSGHATQAFAVASVIAMRSPGWVIPTVAYALASIVAFDRVNDREHFASDVIAGAFFATATGRFIVNRHRRAAAGAEQKPAATLEVVPIRDGLALRARF